jgi:hypothetical protein
VLGVASGTATCSNNRCIGSEPSRRRAWNNAALLGTCHGRRQPDCHDNPSTSVRITSSYDACENSANPST